MNKKRKRKQKHTASIVLIIVALILLIGVAIFAFVSKRSEKEGGYSLDNIANTKQTDNNNDDYSIDESAEDLSDAGITFADLSKYNYTFSSGAGGWSDDFNIEKDGYFHGHYHDSDMGDAGDDYPNGTFYYCDYEGHFANIQRVDEYTCKMTLADIKILNDDSEYIEDGIKYIPAAPSALYNADEIEIYLPGKSVSEISEELQSWLGLAYMEDKPKTLDSPALINVKENQGIASYERMPAKDEANSLYTGAKSSYDYYGDKLAEAETTIEMVEISNAQVHATDSTLNAIWTLVKYNTDDTTFKAALEGQRNWIKERDAEADKAAADYSGGSFATVAYNDKVAELTIKRCQELLKYFK